jgi:hypothetical protein
VPSIETATNVRETRRFVFRRPFEASFGDVPIRLIDLSRSGAQAMHAARIAPGTESRIEVTVPGASRRLSLRARVVWSRRAESSGNQKIGLAITDERFDLAADLIDQMVRMRWVEVDKQATKPGFSLKTPFAPAHSLEQARRALAFVSNDSPAANRWRDRVRASAPPSNRRPIEVLAAWELLARSIDVELVEFAHRERESFVLSASELLDEDECPDVAIAEARRALDFLARHRAIAARWFALVRDAMPDVSHPIEVLAAWELLGRSIDVEVVAIAHRERTGDAAGA